MIGVVFGSGTSLDLLPAKFFDHLKSLEHYSFGVNRVVLSKRLQDADYRCHIYGGWDTPTGTEMDEARKVAYKSHHCFYLNGDWGVPSLKTQIIPLHNSCEWAARILVQEHKCDEIWLIGCEGIGPHCKTLPYFDPYKTNCDMTFVRGGFIDTAIPCAWKRTVEDLKVPFRIYPHWSLLHPYIVEKAIHLTEGGKEIVFE